MLEGILQGSIREEDKDQKEDTNIQGNRSFISQELQGGSWQTCHVSSPSPFAASHHRPRPDDGGILLIRSYVA